jgi:hypothetical protein
VCADRFWRLRPEILKSLSEALSHFVIANKTSLSHSPSLSLCLSLSHVHPRGLGRHLMPPTVMVSPPPPRERARESRVPLPLQRGVEPPATPSASAPVSTAAGFRSVMISRSTALHVYCPFPSPTNSVFQQKERAQQRATESACHMRRSIHACEGDRERLFCLRVILTCTSMRSN